ncbi:hypothetical protein BYT27DRAFT_7100717 [Phlegmacium glaucopus]|nr:hypothetical protein BYT27DRAFT_7100717 [Phlegmacium glaucopus]
MSTEATIYTSVQLRERDKLLSDKHQKEIAILERKLQKVKAINDETAKQLFDAVNRGRRLARSLGFDDVYDAQFTIDSVDHDISFRACYDRLHKLDDQVSSGKKEMATLETRLSNAEGKVKELQIELEEARRSDGRLRSIESTLREQLKRLDEKYDALKDVKERAAERYKVDFKKWRAFNDWLFKEDAEHHKDRNEPGITLEEKKRRDRASIMRKKQKMIEIGPDLARLEEESEDDNKALTNAGRPPPLGRIEMHSNKENERTPVPPHKKRRISTTPNSENLISSTAKRHNSPPPTTPPVLPNPHLKSVTNMSAPSCSPTVFLNAPSTINIGQSLTTRVPLTFHPIPSTLHVQGEPSSTPSPVNDNKPNASLQHSPALKRPYIPSSSDTEDDSQAVYMPISTPGMNGVFKVPAPPPPSNPLKTGLIEQSGVFRFSIQPQLTTSSTSSVMHSRWSEALGGEGAASAKKDKGKSREAQNEFATPATTRTSGQRRIEDYSAFKGRGRYRKDGETTGDTTINAQYTIDPNQNEGLDYQYDLVVRNKDERRRLEAGDCECCREYYEGIGPLPSRLQPPLWRSPPATPARPCLRQSHSHSPPGSRTRNGPTPHLHRQSDIESHKKGISRHRHAWGRANTPPGYWDIGFPDTQTVGDINEKAKQMHKRKKTEIDKEAGNEAGRYRRR